MNNSDIHKNVQNYYGKELQKTQDLKTNACCTNTCLPDRIKSALSHIHPEVISKYYGCGLTIPSEIKGLKILDLGSGSGRDCFITSKLVGEDGYVVGVDMTPEQLEIANKHIEYHTNQFGYNRPNVEFKASLIEQIDQIDIDDEAFDIIISNCVMNLVEDKPGTFKKCYKKLKFGGEMYFSDVYSSRRVPQHLMKDPVLYGECLGGALYWNDFYRFAKAAGFMDPRVIESRKIELKNKEIETKLQGIDFYSVTYRLFKIKGLENDCEDYGQAVSYKGTIEGCPQGFHLDDHHYFEKGRTTSVCGNTFLMLKETRFKKHFEFSGNFEKHYGIFEGCGKKIPYKSKRGGSCC